VYRLYIYVASTDLKERGEKIFMWDVIFQKREENTQKKGPKSKPSLEEPQPPLIF